MPGLSHFSAAFESPQVCIMNRKKFLFVSTPLPYPPNSGSRIRTLNFLRYLASRGEVTLLSTAQLEEDNQHIPALRALCQDVFLVDLKKFYYYDEVPDKAAWGPRVRNFLQLKSWDVVSFSSPEFYRMFLSLNPAQYDLIIFRQVSHEAR